MRVRDGGSTRVNDGTVSVLRVTKEVGSHKYDHSLVLRSGWFSVQGHSTP